MKTHQDILNAQKALNDKYTPQIKALTDARHLDRVQIQIECGKIGHLFSMHFDDWASGVERCVVCSHPNLKK